MKDLIVKTIIGALLFLGTTSFSGILRSQPAGDPADQVYGLDQTLCNGKKYAFHTMPNTQGHQYLERPEFTAGTITLNSKTYANVLLNLDLLHQEVLLKFDDGTGIPKIIEVSKAWLNGFSLGGMDFEYIRQDKEFRIYQVIGTGQVRILFHRYKTLDLEGSIGNPFFKFSPAIRDSYLQANGKLTPFSGNRSFIKLFPPEKRGEIKSFLHKKKINVKKSPDRVLSEFTEYLNTAR